MSKEKIQIKYDNRIIEFEFSEAGKGYVGDKNIREKWYYPEDGAMYVLS